MQKINRVQFAGLEFKSAVRKGRSEETKAMLSLEVGEGLLIKKEEWKLKSTPAGVASNYKRMGIFNVQTLADETGWAVLRTA